MNKMFRARESGRAKAKECLPGQIFTEGLDTVRYDLGRCNSAEEHLLPKQELLRLLVEKVFYNGQSIEILTIIPLSEQLHPIHRGG